MADDVGMRLLVTGGAGYIGQHVVRALRAQGYDVLVLDDLSSGRRELLPDDVPLVVGSITDRASLDESVGSGVSGVVHLAALKSVEESVGRPLEYFGTNVEGTRLLLEAMTRHGVRELVYSSTAAVYGEVVGDHPLDEEAATIPVNPYGESKLVGEWIARDLARASGISCVALRYFNVAGAGSPELVDPGTHNLVPVLIRSVLQGVEPEVFGDDYPTPDGTCIRDYVHVTDLADAHVAAVAAARRDRGWRVYNVGTGRGASVLEVVQTLSRVAAREIQPRIGPRRSGDPASVIADPGLIARELGWRARYGIDDIVRSAWLAATDLG